MLRSRLITAVVGIPLLVVVVLLGDPLYVLLIAFVTARGVWEFCRLAVGAGVAPFARSGIAAAMLVLTAAWIQTPVSITVRLSDEAGLSIQGFGRNVWLPLAAAVLAVGFLLLVRALRSNDLPQALVNWSVTLAGVLYVAVPGAMFILLRQQPAGERWVLLALTATFANDIAAYAVGRLVGRRPMAPRISPNKTWEGFIGGAVCCVLVTGLVSRWLDLPYSTLFGYLLGVPIALLAVFGDLGESLLKRSGGAKDAGALLPGHGGVLDRLDALGPVVLFVYFVSVWIWS